MKRRESENVKRENRERRCLTALDFLLGVDDASRMGGLRFRDRYGGALSLNIDEDSNALDLDTAIEAARYYGLEKDKAASLSKSIAGTVSAHWRRFASLYGISRTETAEMEKCFIS